MVLTNPNPDTVSAHVPVLIRNELLIANSIRL